MPQPCHNHHKECSKLTEQENAGHQRYFLDSMNRIAKEDRAYKPMATTNMLILLSVLTIQDSPGLDL
jgi:hypothetical protein